MWIPALRLARWLGPWADPAKAPGYVERRELWVEKRELWVEKRDAEPVRTWVYTPGDRRALGSLVFAHGVNPWGPADPRSDRFTRVLAGAGFVVIAPFLRDLIRFDIGGASAADELLAVVAQADAIAGDTALGRPGVFALSFGCLPALSVASSEAAADAISGLVVYGGFGDPAATLRRSVGLGDGADADFVVPDPQVLPAIAYYATGAAAGDAPAPDSAAGAWRRLVEETWGVEAMHEPGAQAARARALADALSEPERSLFLRGCGLSDESRRFFEEQIEKIDLSALDVRPRLSGLRCPVRLMHGVGDRVIHHGQMDVLREAMPVDLDVRCFRTGLFEHSRQPSLSAYASAGMDLAREARTLLGMVRAIAEIGSSR